MKALSILVLLLGLGGCANLTTDSHGRPSLAWVLKNSGGCKDQVVLRNKLIYHKCF